MSELDRVLSLKEVAAALGVHRTTLHTRPLMVAVVTRVK